MAKKKVVKVIKLQIPAGKANPAPPIGPALGAAGVNIMGFCKEFNARTQQLDGINPGDILPVEITVYQDKSFTFITKQPPAAQLLMKAAKLNKGSAVPNQNKVAKLSKQQVEEVAKTKMQDLNARDLDAAVQILLGTMRSMGFEPDDAFAAELEAE